MAGDKFIHPGGAHPPQETPTPAYRGSFTHTVDEKGRVSLPAEFRRVLEEQGEERVVITNYISEGARCLEGFGITAWERFELKLREKKATQAAASATPALTVRRLA